jgi:glycosyltransferase involved in cell wall biosynthesis
MSTLKSLDRQTIDDFNLYVVNDCSDDPRSIEVFAEARDHYSHREHWHFVDKDHNSGLSDTRNFAAALGDAEYLCFVDSDNIAMPNMIERFLTCIRNSSSECLTCNAYWFEGDDAPYLSSNPGMLTKPYTLWTPLGASKELGLFHDIYGDANFIVRRDVFQDIGGFALEQRLDYFTTGEDWEFLAKLVIQGRRYDVIPEVLFFYRIVPDSVNRTYSTYQSKVRPLRVFRRELQKVGLQFLVPWVYQMYLDSQRGGQSDYYKHSAEEWEKVAIDRQERLNAATKMLEYATSHPRSRTRAAAKVVIKPVYKAIVPFRLRQKIWTMRHSN